MELYPAGSEVFVLEDLRQCWEVSVGELRQWLTEGKLVSNIWLPVMSVYKAREVVDNSETKIVRELCHWEGYIPLSRHFCYGLFKRGKAYLREFACGQSKQRFSLPDSAESIDVELLDLMVFKEERLRFEREHQARLRICSLLDVANESEVRFFAKDSFFKTVHWNGEDYYFGNMQSNILCLLRDAANRGEPWQSGKRLLHEVGSQSFSLSNVFKHNPIWRELIISDRRGLYRLDRKWLSLRYD
ncbi:hypothetical protein MLD52_09625 [Puniceicoccaceae bacterium K14]|nr:hypothetical protein [Puniceicoccaceae bacterium K14]